MEEIRNSTAELLISVGAILEGAGPYQYNASEIPHLKTSGQHGETKFCGDDLDRASSTFPIKQVIANFEFSCIIKYGVPLRTSSNRPSIWTKVILK